MTLGEFRKQTKNLPDDLTLEIYTERYNDSTQPIRLEFDTEGYIEFIIDDDRWDLVDKENSFIIPEGATNGDVVMAILNPYKICEYKYSVHVYMTEKNFWNANYQMNLDSDWWNAPYKKEVKE